MKKQLLFSASILFSSLLFAQQAPAFGIRAGVTSAGIRGEAVNSMKDLVEVADGAVTTGNRTGFFAGGYVTIPVSQTVSIEPSLNYTQKGYMMRGDLNLKGVEFLGANARAQLTSHYIDLPVVLKANMGGFQVFAGPHVSYLAKADLRATAGALGFNFLKRTMDATGQMNRWDAGLTGGIGYQFKNGVNLSAAYDHGLMRADAGQSADVYNRAVKVGVGISF
ncbi:MAG TPA: porin family protein [Chitinophagaceae bacterium]|nr:porin family protein [Chitinophagaceae bacterium]